MAGLAWNRLLVRHRIHDMTEQPKPSQGNPVAIDDRPHPEPPAPRKPGVRLRRLDLVRAGLALGVSVVLCACCIATIVTTQSALNIFRGLHDEANVQLNDALRSWLESDRRIVLWENGFEISSGNGNVNEVWVVIKVTFTLTCGTVGSDPCTSLANDLAGVVLDNYPRVDEPAGIRVSITYPTQPGATKYDDMQEHALTIGEWRQRLAR